MLPASLALAVLVAGAGTAAAVGISASGSPSTDSSTVMASSSEDPASVAPQVPASVDEQLTSAFQVLRREPDRALPSDVGMAKPRRAAEQGRNLALARAVRTSDANLVVMPGPNQSLCIGAGASGGCAEATTAVSQGVAVVVLCGPDLQPGVTRTFGILPDAATGPQAILSDGTTIRLNLVEGVFEFETPAVPRIISWQLGNREIARPMPVPPGAEPCNQ